MIINNVGNIVIRVVITLFTIFLFSYNDEYENAIDRESSWIREWIFIRLKWAGKKC